MRNTLHGLLAWAAATLFASSASAATISYQDGTADPLLGTSYSGTRDVMLVNNNGSQTQLNYGGRGDFEVGNALPGPGGIGPRQTLISFDLGSLAGKFDSITSATLRLRVNTNTGAFGGVNTSLIYRVSTANGNWVEGNVNGIAAPGASDYNQKQEGVANWAGTGPNAAGNDLVTNSIASAGVNGVPGDGAVFDFNFLDVTFVSDWANGINTGLLLVGTQGGGVNIIDFYSSEAFDPSLRPQLIINYAPSLTQAVPVPTSFALLLGSLVGLGFARPVFARVRRPRRG